MPGYVEFVLRGKQIFWYCDLRFRQPMKNITSRDWWILRVHIAHASKTRSVRRLSEQLAFMGLRLSTRVCPVHLVDELVLVTGPILNLLRFLGGREQVSMVFVPWELMLFLFIYCFIVLLFIYLFSVKSLCTKKCKYYTIFKNKTCWGHRSNLCPFIFVFCFWMCLKFWYLLCNLLSSSR